MTRTIDEILENPGPTGFIASGLRKAQEESFRLVARAKEISAANPGESAKELWTILASDPDRVVAHWEEAHLEEFK